jgi:NADPH2:quinone reductase
MHAMTISAFGAPDVLQPVELPDPRPEAGQITIDVTHAAVGMIDVIFRRGDRADDDRFPHPPFVPGLEVAGTVRELGPGVHEFRVGESVVTLSQMRMAGYASVAVADAALTVSLERTGVDPSQAVAALPNAATAYLALTKVAHLQRGEHVLVHGTTGGLASTFPAVARSLGATRVIGTVGSTSKLEAARALGLDQVMVSDEFPAALGNEQVDLVIDAVGGALRKPSLDVLAPFGRMLVVGHASTTPEEPILGNELWQRNLGVLGFSVGPILLAQPDLAKPAAQAVIPLIADGTLHLAIDELPLARAAEAHGRLERRETTGRINLTIN